MKGHSVIIHNEYRVSLECTEFLVKHAGIFGTDWEYGEISLNDTDVEYIIKDANVALIFALKWL